MPLITPVENDVAIVGFSGRFPGATDVHAFWRNLRDGVESITPLSDKELLGIGRSMCERPEYVRVHAPLTGVQLFDAAFFDMTPREAAMIDPQQRVFLECAWETLEMAGYDPTRFAGRIGVFAGSGMNTYLLRNVLSATDTVEPESHFSIAIANDKDYLTTRVAYKLNLRGPAVTVQTACSTSLVSVHIGCQSVLNGECEMALAGGVAVRVPQNGGYVFHDGGIASPDGHCRAFDAQARGTVFGSGVGIVLLKRLAAAQADGDTIYAVIKGSAVNNDGALKVGFTAPNVDCQAEVIAEAQAIGGVCADSIGYVEAHGTGTPMGDPIEIAALTRAFRLGTQERGYCAIGSVKTNVGHLDTAAGVTGLIKTIMGLRHRQIPPSLHYQTPNPQIDWESSPFVVCDKLTDWPMRKGTRRAGVSSFGIGGTNAHIVLEEAPTGQSTASRPWQLLLLSARTTTALESATTQLGEHLREHPDLELADVAYTTQMGRKAFDQRRFVVCEAMADARAALAGADRERQISDVRTVRDRRVVFMFPGQGSQYVRMGWDLYQSEAKFREEMDRCAEILLPHLGLDLREVIYPVDAQIDEMAGKLEETWLAQPAIFAVSYALARLWMKWGVQPRAMIGHSIGEYVAACLADVFSLEEALLLVAARGRMMRNLPRGAMMAVSLPEEETRKTLRGGLCLAAANAAGRCVVSGPNAEITELERRLSGDGVACRKLHTSHAFHSAMMDPILEQFAARVAQVTIRTPEIPYLSNVTGDWIRPEQVMYPGYWSRHLRETVRFSDGLDRLQQDEDEVLLEVGPGRTLCSAALQHRARSSHQLVLSTMRHSHDLRSDRGFLLTTVGRLWTSGVEIDWTAFWGSERRSRVALPTYPFERKRHWIEPGAARESTAAATAVEDFFYVPSWKRTAMPEALVDNAAARRHWLIFMDDIGLGAAMAERLVAAGNQVTRVTAGEAFSKPTPGNYIVGPIQTQDYAELMEAIAMDGTSPTDIVHLWNVGPALPDEEVSSRVMARGFFSLLALAQATVLEAGDPGRLCVVSSGVHAVTGAEALEPLKATVLGPCKVIPREYAGLQCVHVDIDAMNDVGCLAEQLLVECRHDCGGPSVAYRGPHRWVQTFEKVRLHTPDAEKQRLRENGTYLITGGLGALGLHFGELLARTVHARLILLGRSDFPARDEWQAWLQAHTDSDTTSEIIRRLQGIEDVGGEVLIVKADVTQRENLHAAIECGRIRFGKIHGVIHAAGIAGGGMMQRRTAEECAAVLAPKIDGTRYLRDLFRHDPPEVFVLCSSIEAIRGSFGQVDYCAANCFLDAFAYTSTYRDGFPMVSINWDMWRDTGMASAKAASKPKRLGGDLHPLLGRPLPANPGEHVFEAVFRPEDQWVLNEHRIFDGTGVVPGTAFLEMARFALSTLYGKQAVEFSDVMFIQPLAVPDGHQCEIRTTMVQGDSGFSFEVRSREAANNSGWRNHAVGRLAVAESQTARHQTRKVEAMINELQLSEVPITLAQKEQIGRHGFGPRWDTVERVFVGATDAVALIALPAAFAGDLASFVLHPALLDTAVGYTNLHLGGGEMFLPLSYEKIRAHAALPARFYSHVHFAKDFAASTDTIRYDVTLMDPDGVELVRIDGLVFRHVDASSFATQRKSERLPEDTAAAARAMSGGIRPEDGVEALRRIIARPLGPQVIVSLKDPAKVIEEAGRMQEVEIIEKLGLLARPGRSARMSRPSLSSDYAPPLEGVESQLASIWGELLGVEPVGRNDNFFELGGDSVVAIQMIAKAHHVGVNVTPQYVFRYPSIAELAAVMGEDAGRSRIGIDAADSTRAFALLDLDDEAENMLAQQVEAVDAGQRRGP